MIIPINYFYFLIKETSHELLFPGLFIATYSWSLVIVIRLAGQAGCKQVIWVIFGNRYSVFRLLDIEVASRIQGRLEVGGQPGQTVRLSGESQTGIRAFQVKSKNQHAVEQPVGFRIVFSVRYPIFRFGYVLSGRLEVRSWRPFTEGRRTEEVDSSERQSVETGLQWIAGCLELGDVLIPLPW